MSMRLPGFQTIRELQTRQPHATADHRYRLNALREKDRLTREVLLREVWHYKFVPRTNLVDVHMGRLRRKVDGSNEAPMIRNVRGVGFVLVGEAVRAGHPQFAVGQGREFGESDCKLGHA